MVVTQHGEGWSCIEGLTARQPRKRKRFLCFYFHGTMSQEAECTQEERRASRASTLSSTLLP